MEQGDENEDQMFEIMFFPYSVDSVTFVLHVWRSRNLIFT